MAVIEELIRTEADGSISFGNYELAAKTKKADFEAGGDVYKVKTFRETTRLERNDALVYESDPGTAVFSFREDADSLSFTAEGPEDVQVVLGLEDNATYRVTLNGEDNGLMQTGMGGKLVLSLGLKEAGSIKAEIVRA